MGTIDSLMIIATGEAQLIINGSAKKADYR